MTLRGLSNIADFRKGNCVGGVYWAASWFKVQIFIGMAHHGCYCFTVTHSYVIDLRVSSLRLSLILYLCCGAVLIWYLILPDTQDWKLGIYRNVSLLLVLKDPCSASPLTAERFGQITISVLHLAKLTALGLWVSILHSSLSSCSALLLVLTHA